MNIRTFIQNKKTYLQYIEFRKRLFLERSSKDAEAILYLLPWLFSVNHINCPGFVHDLKRPLRVFNLDKDKEIRKRLHQFHNMFDLNDELSLLTFNSNCCWIEGLYTIGSVGSLTQTSQSDCDMWIVIDRKTFDDKTVAHLHEKMFHITNWFNETYSIPIYFFINEVDNIKRCYFGEADGSESGGSATKGVLKEEHYRTAICICGKTPFWWICHDPDHPINYQEAYNACMNNSSLNYDLIDFGDLEKIDMDEFFGATLWQFNKSLTRPLKSIIKMILLKIMIEAPSEKLICHQFREAVLSHKDNDIFPDPSVYTVSAIFDYYQEKKPEILDFLKICFYLRCEMNIDLRKYPLKKQIFSSFINKYKFDYDLRAKLENFNNWFFSDQIEIGKKIYNLLVDIYKDIVSLQSGVEGSINKRDLTVLGKKIVSCLQPKPDKILILQKPGNSLNVADPTFMFNGKQWSVFVSNDKTKVLIEDINIIKCLSYLVWNDLFNPDDIRMLPNPAGINITEILRLGKAMKSFFGIYNISDLPFESIFKSEHITKIFFIINFGQQDNNSDSSKKQKNQPVINDIILLYENNLLELFIKKFQNPKESIGYIKHITHKSENCKIKFFFSTEMPKIIQNKIKQLLSQTIIKRPPQINK